MFKIQFPQTIATVLSSLCEHFPAKQIIGRFVNRNTKQFANDTTALTEKITFEFL